MSEPADLNCDSCKWLTSPENTVFETDHWKVVLGPEQRYVGRSFATLKRHAEDLSSLTEAEWMDFRNVVTRYEELLRDRFDATLFNWACLMNHVYKTDPYNPHVHWHVKPRYSHPVKIGDKEYLDPEFGRHYDRQAEALDIATAKELKAILAALGV